MISSILATLLSLNAVPVDIRPLAGPAQQGELVSLDSQKMTVTSDGKQTELDVIGLWEVTPQAAPTAPEAPPTVWAELIDGSQLMATQITAADGTAQIMLTSGAVVTVRTRSIRYVRLQDFSESADLQQQWGDILADDRTGDTIVFRRRSSLDYLVGVLHKVTATNVEFEFDGDRVELKREKLDGFLYYNPSGAALPERLCRVTEASGSMFQAREIALADGRIRLVSLAGAKHDFPVEQLKKLDFSSGNTVWLSDLEPESLDWRPYFGSRVALPRLEKLFRPRMDESANGKPLMLDGQTYDKGLAIRSRTQLVYRLTDDFRFFHAVVGIDDQVREQGNVDVVITGDGKQLYSQRVTGHDSAQPINLDVAGVRRLTILVDFGDEMDVSDHLNLCDARLTK
jgi:hypothetical protein